MGCCHRLGDFDTCMSWPSALLGIAVVAGPVIATVITVWLLTRMGRK